MKMYKRKTYHNYWEFEREAQEQYLNLRFQFSYLEAGYYLRHKKNMEGLFGLFYSLAISQRIMELSQETMNAILEIQNEKKETKKRSENKKNQ